MVTDNKKIGISIDEAARNISLISHIPFEVAKDQIINVLRIFAEPTDLAKLEMELFGINNKQEA